MTASTSNGDRMLELLADDAVGLLERQDAAELETLLGGGWDESMEWAAAASVAMMAPELEEMPESLRKRVDDEVSRFVEASGRIAADAMGVPPTYTLRAAEPRARVRPWVVWGGWLSAAAACLALALVVWRGGASGVAGSLAEARASFVSRAADVERASWSDWSLDGRPPEVTGVAGDVVWSESRQRGYVRLKGLPPNDPGRSQYQLWIVDERGLFDDAGQSARISGAIFDASAGETIVPIDPAIPVRDAKAFAVTIEEPGGVWASDMQRRVVIAALDR